MVRNIWEKSDNLLNVEEDQKAAVWVKTLKSSRADYIGMKKNDHQPV